MVRCQQQSATSRFATYNCSDQWRVLMIKGYLQFAAHLARPADVGVTHPQRNAPHLIPDEFRIGAGAAFDAHPQKRVPP